MSMPLLEQAVLDLCCTTLPESVAIADLGCSSGPNTFCAVSEIVTIIYKRCCQLGRSPPRFWVFSNDLPGNDFNSVFKSLLAFHEKTRGKMERSLGHVMLLQFRLLSTTSLFHPEHYNLCTLLAVSIGFPRLREEEIVPGGRMVLPFKARRTPDPVPDESCLLRDQLAQALQELVSEGLIAEEQLDSYNVPYYEPYTEDIVTEIEKEGSFGINSLEIMALPWDSPNGGQNYDRPTSAQKLAKAMRAVHEPMLASHFGAEVMNPLFKRPMEIIAADTREVEHVAVLVSMTRKT